RAKLRLIRGRTGPCQGRQLAPLPRPRANKRRAVRAAQGVAENDSSGCPLSISLMPCNAAAPRCRHDGIMRKRDNPGFLAAWAKTSSFLLMERGTRADCSPMKAAHTVQCFADGSALGR